MSFVNHTYTETWRCDGSSRVHSLSSVGVETGLGALVLPAVIPITSPITPWNV